MSRQELADEINVCLYGVRADHCPAGGVDAKYIGKLERGVYRWPNERYRKAFRQVFGVSTDAELGFYITRQDSDDDVRRRQILPLASTMLVGANVVPRLARLAATLVDVNAEQFSAPPPPYDSLYRQSFRAKSLYQACEYETLTAGLPTLLGNLKAAELAAGNSELPQIHELTSISYHVVASVLLKTGHRSLALIAAERSVHHAKVSQNPVTAAASARIMSHALADNGYGDQAVDMAQHAARRLETDIGLTSPDAASVYGALVLRAAIAAARTNDRDTTNVLLAEGERAAAHLGSDGNRYWTGFGPTNLLLHRVSAALTLGDAGTAIDLARKVDLDRIELTERKACLYVDVAQAYSQWGRQGQALSALRMAYSLAPQELRTRPAVHQIVGGLIASTDGKDRAEAIQFVSAARLPL